MRRGLRVFLLAVGLWSAGVVWAAEEHAPEIRSYVKEVRQKREAAEKAERAARRADPHRRIRPYQTWEEINAELDWLLASYPELASGGTIGRSVEDREIRYVKVSSGAGDKVEFLVTANIHGQELASGQVAMALLRHLLEDYGRNRQVKWVVDHADVYFIPVLNPDGLVRCVRMQERWGITRFVRKNANGVDLNRNFPYPAEALARLKESAAGSADPASEVYRGPEPFSEPETQAFVRFLDCRRFLAAIHYHSAGGWILFPPASTPTPAPDTELMRQMAEVYRSRQFDPYIVGPEIELYPILAGMDDYLYHRYGILSFTVEVGKDMGKMGRRPRNRTYSPIFWAYNTYELAQEAANNIPGALALIEEAIKLYEQPERRRWQRGEERWVGEPEGEPVCSQPPGVAAAGGG